MKKFLGKIKKAINTPSDYDDMENEATVAPNTEGDYVEIDSNSVSEQKKKVIVKTYYLETFEQVKPILDDLRKGNTIALVNIKPLKDKDIIELKRGINKLKKTTDAIEGEIAGFGQDYIVVTPAFAKIDRSKQTSNSDI